MNVGVAYPQLNVQGKVRILKPSTEILVSRHITSSLPLFAIGTKGLIHLYSPYYNIEYRSHDIYSIPCTFLKLEVIVISLHFDI